MQGQGPADIYTIYGFSLQRLSTCTAGSMVMILHHKSIFHNFRWTILFRSAYISQREVGWTIFFLQLMSGILCQRGWPRARIPCGRLPKPIPQLLLSCFLGLPKASLWHATILLHNHFPIISWPSVCYNASPCLSRSFQTSVNKVHDVINWQSWENVF